MTQFDEKHRARLEALVRQALAGSELRRLASENGKDSAAVLKAVNEAADDVVDLLGRFQLVKAQVSDSLLESTYKRFMTEWKQVGVWQGGKPVKAKIRNLIRDGRIDEVWAGLKRLKEDQNRPDPQFVPRPLTWLNQERWNDDPYPAPAGRAVGPAARVLDIDLGRGAGASIQNEIERGRWE